MLAIGLALAVETLQNSVIIYEYDLKIVLISCQASSP